MSAAAVVFWLLASILFTSGIFLVFTKNMVHASLAFMAILLSVAGLFLLTGAEFIALSILVVYVGGVLVLLLFFVFYLGKHAASGENRPFRKQVPSFVLMSLWLAVLAFYLVRLHQLNYFRFPALEKYTASGGVQQEASNTLELGRALFSQYVLEFELIGFLLLIVLVVVASLSSNLLSKDQKTR
jgi:NADH:ubiquinone oxidoreductase subunit 6 (subunit J)